MISGRSGAGGTFDPSLAQPVEFDWEHSVLNKTN